MKKSILYILALAGSMIAVNASAATHYYDSLNGVLGGGAGGTFDSINSSYNTDTQQLTWTITNGQITGIGAVDGFWLVLNDGPNPKSSDVNELAIIYADFNSNKLLAYTYNGANNANSINSPGILIGDYSTDIINSGNTLGFSIDASAINSFSHPSIVAADWKGMQYDDQIGIWFHTSYGTTIGGGAANGYSFDYTAQRWYDKANQPTHTPIPAALFLFAPALLGFLGFRRKVTA